MGSDCSSGGCSAYDSQRTTAEISRLDLSAIGILEFESRVKRFVHPINRGKVSVDQLTEAFRDTPVFSQLKNPYSVVYKLLFSPFFKEMKLSHYEKESLIAYDTVVMSEVHLKDDDSTFDMKSRSGVSVSNQNFHVRSNFRVSVVDNAEIFSFQNGHNNR